MGPDRAGGLVVIAVAVLLAAMRHNGWFTEMNRRLSELAKNFGSAKEKPDDDPLGDDEVADEDYLDDTTTRLPTPISSDQRPEKGDL